MPQITRQDIERVYNLPSSGNSAEVVFTKEDILSSERDSDAWRVTTDLCMALSEECYIEFYSFYIFKLMERGDNAFATEMLQDYTAFEPYLPLL